MTMPDLPAEGSTDWYAHYSALDAASREVGGKVSAQDVADDLGTAGTAIGDAARAAFGRTFIGSGGVADDSAALQAAIDGMAEGGHLTGTLTVRGVARLASGIVLDGGYANLVDNSGANWSGGAGEQFRFIVAGALVPDAGVGTAVTAKGLRDATIDVYFDGGGQASDVGLHIENLIGPDLTVKGNGFAGTLLHADANGDATKNVTQGYLRRVYSQNCGRAIYFRGINAFGTFVEVWDNNSDTGSTFDTCADLSIDHWETFNPASQTYGVEFINCGGQHHGVLNLGDRPTGALLRISGGSFGSIDRVRVTGYMPGANPTVTGVLLEDVQSLTIGVLHSDRMAKALHSKGGDVIVQTLLSEGSDGNPIYIEAGAVRTAPVVDVGIRSFFNQLEAAKVASSVTGGTLRLHGVIDTPNNLGNGAIYAVDVLASGMALDVSGLKEYGQAVLAGSIHHADPAKIRGVDRASLSKPGLWGQAPATWAGFTAGTDYQNLDPRTQWVTATINMSPSSGNDAYCTVSFGPPGAGYQQVLQEVRRGTSTSQYAFFAPVPPGWYFKIGLVNATVNSIKRFYL